MNICVVNVVGTKGGIINICCICQGDGVLLAAGQWYCVRHVDHAFVATAVAVTRILGHDADKAEANAWKWLKKL